MQERQFTGIWIPREIWLDERLSALDKIILAEITSLDNDTYGGCIAGNEYLANFCQCSATKISQSVNLLIKLGYIRRVAFNGRTRVLKSSLADFVRQEPGNCKADTQKVRTINKDINKDINKKDNKRFVPPTLEEVTVYCKERGNNVDPQRFIDYYTSNGWQVGRNKMKDWKAAIRTWEKNGYSNSKPEYKPEVTDDPYNGWRCFDGL